MRLTDVKLETNPRPEERNLKIYSEKRECNVCIILFYGKGMRTGSGTKDGKSSKRAERDE